VLRVFRGFSQLAKVRNHELVIFWFIDKYNGSYTFSNIYSNIIIIIIIIIYMFNG